MKHKHLMIDIETLDTVETAVILSIGALWFDLESGEVDHDRAYYRKISIQDNFDLDRTISVDTLKWWMLQSDGARAEAFGGTGWNLTTAMVDLLEMFFINGDPREKIVWANAPGMDLNILKHAFRTVQNPKICYGDKWGWPFEYYNERDVRTYRDDVPWACMHIDNEGAHHPLSDCLYQIRCVCAVHEVKTRAFGLLDKVSEEEQ